jgi:hypothetical protein
MVRPLLRLAPLLCLLAAATAHAQAEKEVNHQAQFWTSLNTTARLDDRWGLVADVHVRRNDFVRDPSFYLLRAGAHFWATESLTLTVGYAHNFVAPTQDDWHEWTDEDRVYQQIQYASRAGRVKLLQRVRNEQRWQQQVEDDVLTGQRKLTDRVRLLESVTIPLSTNSWVPSLVISDEVALQFGSAVVNNTFDQNRLFTGIKHALGPNWSYDLGYMLVFQQKASGYQYDLNHTLRWFFYWTPDWRAGREHGGHEPASSEE